VVAFSTSIIAPIAAARRPSGDVTRRGRKGITPSKRLKMGSMSRSAEPATPPPRIMTSGASKALMLAIARLR
jgi:hypothetical protein